VSEGVSDDLQKPLKMFGCVLRNK